MKNILLVGAARAGKDSFARAIINHTYGFFARVAVADRIKYDLEEFLRKTMGLDIWDEDDKILAREMLVAYGNVWRKKDPNHWINIVRKDIAINKVHGHFSIITDVRYAHEFDAMSAQDDIVCIGLVRDGVAYANDDEARELPALLAKCAITINIPSFDKPDQIYDYYANLAKTVTEELKNH